MTKLTLEERQEIDAKKTKTLIKKVKIAQKQLNMDDDSYRAMLKDVTGKTSSTKLKSWQLENVLSRMKLLGFAEKAPSTAGTRPQADDAQSKLIRSLWLQLHEAKKVNDPSERALVNWAKGQFKSTEGIEALQWLSQAQRSIVIEQLKRWLSRK